MITKCPNLSPKCDGNLKISQREAWVGQSKGIDMNRKDSKGELVTRDYSGKPLFARCDKCGRQWSRSHLEVEGINIDGIEE